MTTESNYAEYGAIMNSILGQLESVDRRLIDVTSSIKRTHSIIFKSTKPMYLATPIETLDQYFVAVLNTLMETRDSVISSIYKSIPEEKLIHMARHAIGCVLISH